MDKYIDQIITEMEIPKPVQSVEINIMDEPIPETVKRRLLKSLLSGKPQPPRPPPYAKSRRGRPMFSLTHILNKKYSQRLKTTRKRSWICP